MDQVGDRWESGGVCVEGGSCQTGTSLPSVMTYQPIRSEWLTSFLFSGSWTGEHDLCLSSPVLVCFIEVITPTRSMTSVGSDPTHRGGDPKHGKSEAGW